MLTEGLFFHEPGIREAHNAYNLGSVDDRRRDWNCLGLQSQGIVLLFAWPNLCSYTHRAHVRQHVSSRTGDEDSPVRTRVCRLDNTRSCWRSDSRGFPVQWKPQQGSNFLYQRVHCRCCRLTSEFSLVSSQGVELRSSLRNFESQNEHSYKPCINRRFQNANALQSGNQTNFSWFCQTQIEVAQAFLGRGEQSQDTQPWIWRSTQDRKGGKIASAVWVSFWSSEYSQTGTTYPQPRPTAHLVDWAAFGCG